MGFFSAIKQGFNEGRKISHAEAEIRRNLRDSHEVVRMIEPNYGRIITFKINAEEPYLHMYEEQLFTLAKGVKATATVSDTNRTVTLTCPDFVTAKSVRESF